jgi:hypothetical protein
MLLLIFKYFDTELKRLENSMTQVVNNSGVVAQIKRSPLGVVLVAAPCKPQARILPTVLMTDAFVLVCLCVCVFDRQLSDQRDVHNADSGADYGQYGCVEDATYRRAVSRAAADVVPRLLSGRRRQHPARLGSRGVWSDHGQWPGNVYGTMVVC